MARPGTVADHRSGILRRPTSIRTRLTGVRSTLRQHTADDPQPRNRVLPTDSPIVSEALDCIRRAAADNALKPTKAPSLTKAHLGSFAAVGPERPTRFSAAGCAADIALVNFLFDAGLRVSETAAARWSDITLKDDGTGLLVVRRRKADQEGDGAEQPISRIAMADPSERLQHTGDTPAATPPSLAPRARPSRAACTASANAPDLT